ncbi:MAG: hypothetical protein JSS66_18780 [Armatimonadetes bacterium]|nr:hypothetical protein [Armatimonadota bacterium]
MTLLEGIGIAFSAVLTVNFLFYLRSGKLKRDFACLRTLKGRRWLVAIPASLLVLAGVIAIGSILYDLSPAVLGWSWTRLIAEPKESGGQNLMVSGLKIPGFAWVFLPLLGLNVPRLALNEEWAFRKGFKKPAEITFQSFKFGMAHCLVGIPIAFGLALSIAGAWFALQYLKGGVRRSAAYHSIHNWALLLLAGLWLLSRH